MSNKYVLILVDGLNNMQRNQIQAEVTSESTNWWHEFLDVWIVETDKPVVLWRNRLRVVVGIGGELIVMGLPEVGKRSWATKMKPHNTAWFGKHFTNKAKAEQPDDEPPF